MFITHRVHDRNVIRYVIDESAKGLQYEGGHRDRALM